MALINKRGLLLGVASSLVASPAILHAARGVQNGISLISIGDSQTSERSALGGATMIQTYPYLIAKSHGWSNVSNVGISGNTSAQMLARAPTQMWQGFPSIGSMMGAVNNMTTNISGGVWVGGGISAAQTKADFKAVAQPILDQRGKFTFLTAVPVFQTVYLNNAAAFMQAVKDAGTELGIPVVDVYGAFIALDPTTRNSYLLDDQHPNAAGMAYIASLCGPPAFTL